MHRIVMGVVAALSIASVAPAMGAAAKPAVKTAVPVQSVIPASLSSHLTKEAPVYIGDEVTCLVADDGSFAALSSRARCACR